MRSFLRSSYAAFLVVIPTASWAQFNLGSSQRADDGTVYEVIAVPAGQLLAGAEEVRITAVAGSPIGLQACSGGGATSGAPLSSLTGGDQAQSPPQALLAFFDTLRTEIFLPNDAFAVSFVPDGSGRLTIGTGGGAVDVCIDRARCTGGADDAPALQLTCDSDGVPPACVASSVAADCASGRRSTLAFGRMLDPDGDALCNTPPTTDTLVCAAPPADGFTLRQGEVIVFIYVGGGGPGGGFAYGASGFGVDRDGANLPMCAANSVVTADAQSPSGIPLQTPTHSPAPIATGPSPTATATRTPRMSGTCPPATSTPTQTATTSPTPAGCAGDCDGDEHVTIDELIVGVNIALEQEVIARCTRLDRDGNREVTVEELIGAVDRALNGC